MKGYTLNKQFKPEGHCLTVVKKKKNTVPVGYIEGIDELGGDIRGQEGS